MEWVGERCRRRAPLLVRRAPAPPGYLLIRTAAVAAAALLGPVVLSGERALAAPVHTKSAPKPKPAPPPPAPKPKPVPTAAPVPTAEPAVEPAKPPKQKKLQVAVATCTPESLAEIEPNALRDLVKKKCTNLRVPEGSAPTEIGDAEMLVVLCLQEQGEPGEEPVLDVVEPRVCGLRATATVQGGGAPIPFAADGDLAMALKTTRIAKESPANGASITLTVTWTEAEAAKTARSQLLWRRSNEGYGRGKGLWFPLPMFTTDFSGAPGGYRFGISPVAVAFGWRFYPSSTSRAYFGASGFVAWNVLIPNDTQTLSNGTTVRINYKAFGAGVLLDAAGFVAVGLGLGHTFTSDSRTDFRTWIYLGPRLLFGLNDF